MKMENLEIVKNLISGDCTKWQETEQIKLKRQLNQVNLVKP